MGHSNTLALASRRSDWRIQVAPSLGAAALAIEARHAGQWYPVAHPTSPETLRDDLRVRYSNYALLPYSNRIENGMVPSAYGCSSKRPLPPNWPGSPHPLHGIGWQRPWRITQRDGREARLALDWLGGDAWPWPLRGEQRLRLLGRNVLQMDLRLINTGTELMPAGLGWHPYFMADAGATLRTRARWMQAAGPDGLPIGLTNPPVALAQGRKIDIQSLPHLDNGFAGWSGEADLCWPQRAGLHLRLQALGALRRHCVIYRPSGETFFCLEPVSHANNSLALYPLRPLRAAALGQRWLAPGEALCGGMRLLLLPSQG
jgi:aldose 1-epimerase